MSHHSNVGLAKNNADVGCDLLHSSCKFQGFTNWFCNVWKGTETTGCMEQQELHPEVHVGHAFKNGQQKRKVYV